MNDKISIKQAYILILAIAYSPIMRFVPYYTAKEAKQASWLAPFVGSVFLFVIVLILHGLYKKYHDQQVSYADIIYFVFGKWVGKIITFLYFIFMTILLSYLARYYCERLISTAYDSVDIKVFLISMFVFIAVVMRTKLVILARMSEIIFLILLLLFINISTLSIPNIELSRLTPISLSDALPVFKAGFGVAYCYLLTTYIFFMSDKFHNTKYIKKIGIELVLFFTIVIPILVIATVGVLNYSTIVRSTIPYLISVKQISLFNTIEKIDAIVVGIWILSDFVLLCLLAYINVHVLESIFELKESKNFNNIYLVFVALFSLTFAVSKFELEDFEQLIMVPASIVFGLCIPALTYAIGKLRKKV